MRTLGMAMDSHLAGLTGTLPEGSIAISRDVACDADVNATQAYLSYRSQFDPEHPARPYMHIVGECRAIRGDIPCGVKEVHFADGCGIPVDIMYEFGNDELADMVRKGMFDSGFECPSIITENVLEMPVYCDFKVVVPQTESDTPIVFADISDRRCIEVAEETCGYRFGDYFEQAVPKPVPVHDDFDMYDDYGHEDLFADDYAPVVAAEEETVHELTAHEKAVEKHYANIRTRVVRDHILQKGGVAKASEKERVPHKALETGAAEKEPALETQIDALDAIAHDAAVEAVEKAPAYGDDVRDARDDAASVEVDSEFIDDDFDDDVEDDERFDAGVYLDDYYTDAGGSDETPVIEHELPEHLKDIAEMHREHIADDSQYE